jgi:hypothetical protein
MTDTPSSTHTAGTSRTTLATVQHLWYPQLQTLVSGPFGDPTEYKLRTPNNPQEKPCFAHSHAEALQHYHPGCEGAQGLHLESLYQATAYFARLPYTRKQWVRLAVGPVFDGHPVYPTGRFGETLYPETLQVQALFTEIGRLTAQRIQGEPVEDDELQAILASANRLSSQAKRLIAEAFHPYNQQVDYPEEVLLARGCEHLVLRGQAQEDHRGDLWCGTCADQHLVVPEDDNEFYYRDDLYRHSCGGLYTYEEEDDDRDEEEGTGDANLCGYSTVAHVCLDAVASPPDPSRSRDFHLGLELEVESGGRRSSDVEQVLEDLGDRYVLCKEDGSLDDNRGFEIVTAPRPLATHLQSFGTWTPPYGLRAWDAECCGMHVHIDSRAFTPASLARLLAFYNRRANTALIGRVAGRHPETSSQCRSYANYDSADGSFTTLRRSKRDTNASRYVMVNTTTLDHAEGQRLLGTTLGDTNTRGFSTVEIRVFRASLRKARLLAQIEFAHAVVVFCRHTNASQLEEPHFRAWLATEYRQYPALARFLGIDVPRRSPVDPTAATAAEAAAELLAA